MIDPVILQQGSDWRAQAEVFDEIFFIFLALGTLVGTIVVAYTLWNVYKYRDDGSEPKEDFDAPVVGELPTGQGGPKAKKLFLSFGLSAIVVISLVVYAYGILLYVEEGPDTADESDIEILVEGYQFGWEYEYPNGHTTTGEMVVPADHRVNLDVTSRDVWHNFGSSELRIKSDAIPGETSEVWFSVSSEEVEAQGGEATYRVECFELCGAGHSAMTGQITVLPQDEWEEWYAGTQSENTSNIETTSAGNAPSVDNAIIRGAPT
ncbi:cytochrome c oxidase subunit II [Halorubrum salipaludis]|jgi:cytochrome c oxidase subunit 2|uniref:Cytochrome c oxidase subunit II n=1 Tax=Halorubrum salipaludis TaxID=2032630 RepID=A0A2A2EWW6_9EURY|nr:cytochrome c oxidase subunit II [Halorubrum salipaludis]PAU76954.1 cytochrome c oxidase subunit II [Halorubrum salipaludis]